MPPNAKIIIIIKTFFFLNSCINALFLEDNIKPFLDSINGLQLWKTHVMFLYCIMLGLYMANWNWIRFIFYFLCIPLLLNYCMSMHSFTLGVECRRVFLSSFYVTWV